jgi:hypothetical protein
MRSIAYNGNSGSPECQKDNADDTLQPGTDDKDRGHREQHCQNHDERKAKSNGRASYSPFLVSLSIAVNIGALVFLQEMQHKREKF